MRDLAMTPEEIGAVVGKHHATVRWVLNERGEKDKHRQQAKEWSRKAHAPQTVVHHAELLAAGLGIPVDELWRRVRVAFVENERGAGRTG